MLLTVRVLPAHMAPPVLALTVGEARTFTVDIAVLLQPAALVPVTVYTPVDEGEAVTVAPVVAERPVAGDQW